jgi:hypothetical protein
MGSRALFMGTAALATVSLMLPAAAPAQNSRAGVVTTLQGTATVARASTPQPAPLKFRDDVFVRDRITTGDESIARILLGGKAVVTIRERSNLTITETPTTSTIEIASGKIALSVNKDRVKPGESVEIKTPNAVAAIRGTIIVAEVESPAARPADVSTRFTLLTGVVDVTRIDHATGHASGPVVVMKPLQSLGLTGFGALGVPQPITRAEADAVASGFAVKLPDPVRGVNAKVLDDQVKEATRRIADESPRDKGNDLAARDKDRSSKAKDDGGDRGSSATGDSGGSAAGSGGRMLAGDRGIGGTGDILGDKRSGGRGDNSGPGKVGRGRDNIGGLVGGDDIRGRDKGPKDRQR